MEVALFDRIARLYDYEVKDFVRDIPFYVEYAKECGGDVLELGCGTGRVLIPIAKEGIKITGLDASERMLAIARKKVESENTLRKNVTLVHGDMKSFKLKEEFSLIYIAFRSFQCLLTKEDQVTCLACVLEHLAKGGYLIVDLFAPRHDLLAQSKVTLDLGTFYDEERGLHITRRSEVQYDLAKQTLHEDRVYEWKDGSGKACRDVWSYEIAYLFRYESELLLEKCGFRVDNVYGDFDKSPYDYYSGEQIFVARKFQHGRINK
ncbi:MAG: class I SAM-dependent methyltransferase [candidate division WOR-3 bacterium]|nr:MAG: class I SAM-dependent methyltransferase [candidate division WOR-3 bacterium]